MQTFLGSWLMPRIIVLAVLVSLLGAPPLGATCSCSITATFNQPDLVLFGRELRRL